MYKGIINWLPLILVFITGIFALHRIRANNITNARIKWLENLKQIISDFFSECTVLIIKEGIIREINERRQPEPNNETIKLYYDKINESLIDHLKIINSKHDLLKLNLNPKEDLHNKFETLLDVYMNLFNKIPVSKKNAEGYKNLTKTMDSYSNTLLLMARFIMKLEWDKTKKSFLSYLYYIKYGKGKRILKEALSLTNRV